MSFLVLVKRDNLEPVNDYNKPSENPVKTDNIITFKYESYNFQHVFMVSFYHNSLYFSAMIQSK